jgi:glucose-1-phosphate thymidylyltransferase
MEYANAVKPSSRGELEITTLNRIYLELGELSTTVLDRGTMWFDTGTFDSLYTASSFLKTIEERQGQKIGCLEEIAWRNKWISDKEIELASVRFAASPYGGYLNALLRSR